MKKYIFTLAFILTTTFSFSQPVRPTPGEEPVVVPPGSERAPGLYIYGDRRTGFFSDGPGQLKFVSRGVTIADFLNLGGGLSISGTPDRVAKFNATGDDLVDSQILDEAGGDFFINTVSSGGAIAITGGQDVAITASGSGDIDITAAVNMDLDSDDLDLILTAPSGAGVNQVTLSTELSGVTSGTNNIMTIDGWASGSGFGSEFVHGLVFNDDWESDINNGSSIYWAEGPGNFRASGGFTFRAGDGHFGDGNGRFHIGATPAAGFSGQFARVYADIENAMDEATDQIDGLYIDVNQVATHTAGNVNAIYAEINTADADVIETAFRIGSGFDAELLFEDTSAAFIYQNSGTFQVSDNGINTVYSQRDAALGAQQYFEFDVSLPIMDGNDIQTVFFIDVINPDHTGTNNFVYGMNFDNITADANAVESAIRIGSGWERGIDFTELNNSVIARWPTDWRTSFEDSTNTAALQMWGRGSANPSVIATGRLNGTVSDTILQVETSTHQAMDGNDTQRYLHIEAQNADHTGTNNFLYAIDIDSITGDAQATEAAIRINNGWDYELEFENNPVIRWNTNQSLVFSTSTALNLILTETAIPGFGMSVDRAIVGSAQNLGPTGIVVEATAASAADVTTITPPASDTTNLLTIVCADSNLTFNDSDAAGAANTLNLAGAATNFTCSADDTLTLAWVEGIGTGNDRWLEVGRSVN